MTWERSTTHPTMHSVQIIFLCSGIWGGVWCERKFVWRWQHIAASGDKIYQIYYTSTTTTTYDYLIYQIQMIFLHHFAFYLLPTTTTTTSTQTTICDNGVCVVEMGKKRDFRWTKLTAVQCCKQHDKLVVIQLEDWIYISLWMGQRVTVYHSCRYRPSNTFAQNENK